VLRVSLVGLIAGGKSGIPRYAAALTDALDRIAPEFPELALSLLTTPAGRERTAPRTIELQLVGGRIGSATGGPRRIVAEQLAARGAAGDLLHFFDLTGPLLAPGRPFTATLHDAGIRHRFETLRVAHKQILGPLAIRRARAIVAVSGFARDEAVRYLGAQPERIHVIHSGPGLVNRDGPAAGQLAGHPDHYLLYVGNLAAHKNLPMLVRAYGAAGIESPLILVGSWGARGDEVRAAIEASPARRRIELRTGVSDAELDGLYRGAQALLLPSLYEGFGFTALEAMARGCAVLASDIPALREVCGDGAWLLAPSEEAEWANAIRTVVADPGTREDLRRRGTALVGRYSWERTAREVCDFWLNARSQS
jgi:glycosyltransferase involved in cell wall biosynthesis